MTELRITATDASTVITGAANIHRFDAPTSREIAGTVRSVLGPDPHGAPVHIAADPQRLSELTHALADYDIDLTTEPLQPVAPTPDDTPEPFHRPPPPEQESRSGVWIIAAVVAAVALACAAVIWGLTSGKAQSSGEAEPPPSQPPETQSTPVSSPVQEEERAEQSSISIERDGLTVQLPAGFTLEADDDMWRATGSDPNFRLQIAVEHLYQLPARTMADQLLADIETDPEVELVDTDGISVTYLERAGDGSQSLWKTWPNGTVQLFVGCHTRTEPTVVQRATCRMAMESAEYKGADVGP
ncbi:type VII secretion-associated protein [Corynebacterium afermentans]|uniref:type VII secretion-associated protein n=1 Tax=Corynebacterium afermentans TaxID=38286 RepID=UPI002572D9D8|nr:type VII secretion-associated protein [Corynebacterium afermentans]MCG7291489.1 type VII secretion-associated protein [Corynebacterium afermentans]